MTPRRLLIGALLAAVLTGCAGGDPEPTPGHGAHDGHGGPNGHMDEGPGQTGRGLVAAKDGYALTGVTLPEPGQNGTIAFRILAPGGKPQTRFQIEQTKQMHVYVVRNDLADFDHVHPTMASDGTWTAPLTLERPGPYRVVTEFVAVGADGKDHHLVLGANATLRGSYQAEPLPGPAPTVTADPYEVAVRGDLKAAESSRLTVFVTRNAAQVTDLQPFLESYAHLTGFRTGDLAVVHLHPNEPATGAALGGPELTFDADFPGPGRYRIFVQFQIAGALHTAAATVAVA